MPFFTRLRPRWPPSPCVEDEIQSLSRELHGATILKQESREDVCVRGTVDQYPLIITLHTEASSSSTIVTESIVDQKTQKKSPSQKTTPPVIKERPAVQPPRPTVASNCTASIPGTSVNDKSSAKSYNGVSTQPPKTGRIVNDKPPLRSSNGEVPTQPPRSSKPATVVQNTVPVTQQIPHPNATVSASTQEVNAPRRSSTAHERAATASSAAPPPRQSPPPPPPHKGATRQPSGRSRSGSIRFGHSEQRSSTYQPVSKTPGYVSDSATANHREPRGRTTEQRTAPQDHLLFKQPVTSPTLAERLEEKLRRRHELRDVESDANHGAQAATITAANVNSQQSLAPNVSAAPKQSIPRRPSQRKKDTNVSSSASQFPAPSFENSRDSPKGDDESVNGYHLKRPSSTSPQPSPSCRPGKEADPFEESFAAASQAPEVSSQVPPNGQLTRSKSLNKSSADHARRSVAFFDEEIPRASQPRRRSQSSRRGSPSKEIGASTPSSTSSLCLLPCPRSTPTAGHQDWYTIKGLTHLDICPSCMTQVGQSKFRDFFIPSLPKPRDQAVRCSLSEPWTRLAWLQTIKKQHDDLEMLYHVSRPPPGSFHCPGHTVAEEYWYRVVDPDTGMFLPKFNVCPACVRSIRILMPAHRDTFKCSSVPQERVCDMATHSPRFVQFIDLLDMAANRAEFAATANGNNNNSGGGGGSGASTSTINTAGIPDMREFLAYARRKVVLRDCRRDRLILSAWHYIPQLPELTACEDCYDDVIWPLARANKPLARMFSTSMRLLPGDGPTSCREASCQLYSPRMRAKFREAVAKNDFTYLRLMALRRFDAEQRFRDRRQGLLEDEARGYNRETELRKNAEEWKKWE
ncbi:hypothetical protein ASPZODRAFT_126857 [Penicilliopsis zonata CBS 506.65]|uniref:Uncharacterized protein n=1 Tax=Penicilliopsis zonata CBS 506.65 TaxID=1073090 RepID=A0A1L9SUJ8_9EURO|nr:hypothetical protein ASPZODRAFT_126857 [Penicilliopsis zonata CBS 506.65]OJJ50890.1 hypothetical protein ASPZODRAFT_126857 [Penicilliopsis zonata CBS 506.65]